MENVPELKNCPFCNGKMGYFKYSGIVVGHKTGFCKVISATSEFSSIEEAAEAWNNRFTEETTTPKLDAKKAYEELIKIKIDELVDLSKELSLDDFRYICFEDGVGNILSGCVTMKNDKTTPYGEWLDKYKEIL